MNTAEIQAIFSAQTENVKELKGAWTHINRDLNNSYLKNQQKSVSLETKLMALVYCALAESIFSKLIHTPRCFTANEISQIKAQTNSAGVQSGWLKCLQLSLQRVQGKNSGHVHNVNQDLNRLIKQYIFDPSILRNKLAHGQWVKALNRENDKVNEQLTQDIGNLTVVSLYQRKVALEKLSAIMADIIESPSRAHPRDYWSLTAELGEELQVMDSWTVEEKIRQLKHKRSKYANTV